MAHDNETITAEDMWTKDEEEAFSMDPTNITI